MPSQKKAALITGGASGMGLAVATSLAARSDWELHLVDLNPSAGAAAAQSLPSAVFHQADVANYDSLASTFKDMFRETERLDFVFANAGVAEKSNFYQKQETGNGGLDPPPEPSSLLTRTMFDGVISTCCLALHYFRLSPDQLDKSIAITASCGGISVHDDLALSLMVTFVNDNPGSLIIEGLAYWVPLGGFQLEPGVELRRHTANLCLPGGLCTVACFLYQEHQVNAAVYI